MAARATGVSQGVSARPRCAGSPAINYHIHVVDTLRTVILVVQPAARSQQLAEPRCKCRREFGAGAAEMQVPARSLCRCHQEVPTRSRCTCRTEMQVPVRSRYRCRPGCSQACSCCSGPPACREISNLSAQETLRGCV